MVKGKLFVSFVYVLYAMHNQISTIARFFLECINVTSLIICCVLLQNKIIRFRAASFLLGLMMTLIMPRTNFGKKSDYCFKIYMIINFLSFEKRFLTKKYILKSINNSYYTFCINKICLKLKKISPRLDGFIYNFPIFPVNFYIMHALTSSRKYLSRYMQ